MMSISSLLSEPSTNINSKPFSRPSSSSPPIVRSQKVIQTIRPSLSPIASNHSAMSTSPNLSESSNDEQSGIMHQTIGNYLNTTDNSDTRVNNKFHQKMHYQTTQIHHHDFLSPHSSNTQLYQNQDNLIPPLLLNNTEDKKINTNNQNPTDLKKSLIQPSFDLKIPDAVYYEKDGMKYGIRCVCGDPRDDGFLVQCEKCDMWLHGSCLNYARNIKGEHFYCPFCLKTKIQCVCGKSMYYDLPLIQCKKCGNWSHKPCEDIEYGIIPSNFICTNCRNLERPKSEINNKVFYEIPYVKFSENDKDVLDLTIFTSDSSKSSSEDKRFDIIASIPDGPFQNMIIDDLNIPELNFRSFMEKYFHTFAPLFFDRIHEFFRVFNETVCSIFNIKKNSVLRALDVLANRLLYNQSSVSVKFNDTDNNNDNEDIEEVEDDEEETNNDIEHSESINNYIKELQVPRLEKIPENTELYTDHQRATINSSSNIIKNRRKRKNNDGNQTNNTAMNDFLSIDNENSERGVFTPVSFDDGAFITEIPGFLIHSDEIKADNGLPYSSILLTDGVLFIDTNGTPFQQLSTRFRRSFHFNCIAKLIRIKGDLRVALFATRLQGPLSEEKTRRGDAVLANTELILPFDGYIPFPTKKIEWKARKKRKFNYNAKQNFDNHTKIGNNEASDTKNPDLTDIYSLLKNNNNNLSNSNEKSNDTSQKEVPKKPKKKITQQTVAKRCTIDPNLTLLSTFMDESVPPMPFIILSDQEDIDTYKIQIERIKSRILSQ